MSKWRVFCKKALEIELTIGAIAAIVTSVIVLFPASAIACGVDLVKDKRSKMKKNRKLIPIIIELVGIATVGTGIGMELAIGGEVYLVVITMGSCLIAAGGIIWGKFMRK